MTFKIITLGCKVNIYESEVMKEKLLQAGFKETIDNSDIVIINTCSVTNMADVKSRKMIRREKKENPQSILAVCGCSAENHRLELEDLGIDILIGNKDKSNIVSLIREYQNDHKPITKFYDTRKLPFEDMEVDKFTSHTRGFIKIQDGCNNYCSYCIIPYVRGNIRSKDINVALKEAQELVANNHKEIVLTGIHTGSYGVGCDFDLVDLINKMSTIPGLKRIRLSSIEITELNDKFMELLKNNTILCDHLHIPLQSGSEKILKLMNRKYDKSRYESIINQIRAIRPEISITTDVIVGFPGETESDFNECLDFCRKIKYAKIHVFPYSKREGTKAASMPNQLDNKTKKDRARKLIELSNELEETYNQKFVGRNMDVLVEEHKDGCSIGHTSNYLKVVIKGEVPTNEFYNVKITNASSSEVAGKIN